MEFRCERKVIGSLHKTRAMVAASQAGSLAIHGEVGHLRRGVFKIETHVLAEKKSP